MSDFPTAELINWWLVLFSPPPQLKMAFAGILSDADITAALAACQGKPCDETRSMHFNLGKARLLLDIHIYCTKL